MTAIVAVLNAGSSSIKFAVHESGTGLPLILGGQVEAIGVAPKLTLKGADGAKLVEQEFAAEGFDHGVATRTIIATVREHLDGRRVSAIGHRVVHGGTLHSKPVRIDAGVLAELETLIPLAPLHQPHNLAPIRAVLAEAPDLPQVACFDTAFHAAQPPVARRYAIPRALSDEGVLRYGFHGLSYEFIARRLKDVAPHLADARVVVAHLGNGASLCAMHGGKSVASTMGFTAVEGLMMGTRCGSIDPGILLYLMDQKGMDARAIEKLLYKDSGLLGVSGISSDMRALRTSDAPEAREAIDLFIYRIVREIGSMVAALGGIDALIFTAGIGENDVATRAEVVAGCGWLGVEADPALNARPSGKISPEGKKPEVWVISTDEERVIVGHTLELVAVG
jgi:acetate kinase